MQGLPTIRAYGAESAFQSAFINHLSLNGSWWFAYLASSRWIGFRLDLIATVTLTMAVLLATAVRQHVSYGMVLWAMHMQGWRLLCVMVPLLIGHMAVLCA
jgi:ATP-binding cassette subfamily C (CFTR/MRP) protein 4